MPTTFEVTVLGASGGPDTGSTQCFLIRPFGWHGLESICIDGGAGTTQIANMLAGELHNGYTESFYEKDYEPANRFFDPGTQVQSGLPNSLLEALKDCSNQNVSYRVNQVYQSIKGYYITHPHLDHIAAMVLDSPLIFGSANPMAKTIRGLPFATNAIEHYIFNDTIWPDLVQGGGKRLKMESLTDQCPIVSPTFPRIEITPFKVSHGTGAYSFRKRIYSTVYLLHDKITGHCIVICGDMEPDDDEPLLLNLWTSLASKIPLQHIKAIMIECSSPMAIKKLYGHMSPARLVRELHNLRRTYDHHALSDMNVIITHVKSICSTKDPRLVILDEVRHEAQKLDLKGIRFSIAIKDYTFYV